MDPEFLKTVETIRDNFTCSVEAALVTAGLLFVADSVENMTEKVLGPHDDDMPELPDGVEVVTEPAAAVPTSVESVEAAAVPAQP